MKYCYPLILFCWLSGNAFAQCVSWPVPLASLQVVSVDGQAAAQPVGLAFDSSFTTYFASNGNAPFPHEIVLDLGISRVVNQIALWPRIDQALGKTAQYEVYASDNLNAWGDPQAAGLMVYDSLGDDSVKYIGFGGVSARYVKLRALSNFDAGNANRWMIAEMRVFADTCAASGKSNQTLIFPAISKQLTTNQTLTLTATASTGLPVTYEWVSGPATVAGDQLSFTGTGGRVVVKAVQAGDATYFPSERLQYFEVIDPALYAPEISTRLVQSYLIEMPLLRAYPIYANASISHPDVFSVDSMLFIIDGRDYPTTHNGSLFTVWWQPDSFGPHAVELKAFGSNGVTGSVNRTVVVFSPIGGKTVNTFQGEVINWGSANPESVMDTFELPQFVGTYSQVMADFWVTCPSVPGGCDDWDRIAKVELKNPEGEWVEFIRYITPYGVACSHTLDVTDFASLLQGRVPMRVVITTYGTGGWSVHLRLRYLPGTPTHVYSQVNQLWYGYYDFGNPANLQPFDTIQYSFPAGTVDAHLNVVTTGHGWGNNNTSNAAEFFPAVNYVMVGSTLIPHNFWRVCNPNPDGCQPQNGTYQYARAGWCPGAISPPTSFDFSSYLNRNRLTLSYILHPGYVDQCHANNPNCRSGITCPDCNDGFNPAFQVSASMITFSDTVSPTIPRIPTSLDPEKGTFFAVVPNPTGNYFRIETADLQGPIGVTVLDLNGAELQAHTFPQVEALAQARFSLAGLPGGVYLVKIISKAGVAVEKVLKVN